MLYLCANDFFKQAENAKRLSREEERKYASEMQAGNESARRILTDSYLPVLAAYLKRFSAEPSLELIYRGLETLDEAISHFNFEAERPPFSKFLGDRLRQTVTRYIADRK